MINPACEALTGYSSEELLAMLVENGQRADLDPIEEARAQSQQTGRDKLVFVDFTGQSCTNCKINENSVFSKLEFKQLLKSYNLVQLYTDVVPNHFYASAVLAQHRAGAKRQKQDADVNHQFEIDAFQTEQLPLYAILRPLANGKVEVVGTYDEGKINDQEAFAKFLTQPLDGQATLVQAKAARE